MNKIKYLLIAALSLSLVSFSWHKPTLYIIGDSTVRNGDGTGSNSQWGWGSIIGNWFDTGKISISNQAIGGRSSRTFLTEGRWDRVVGTLQKGDFLIMQFGHNDASPLDDTARARGTLKGVENDSVEIYNPIRKQKEIVHSYGWYIRKFTTEAQAKGATVVICSPIPRNNFKDGKVTRSEYADWAEATARQTGAFYIQLNELVAVQYEKMDTAAVHAFFPADHTHTNKEGASLNAAKVVEGIKQQPLLGLNAYLIR
ncbi:rhamnogalacturonan acetylesterase [Filimonas effusa]|uniref:Rhamnogalacturonan acetylesterase n=1 Tax=Filimonas effusa TaxID=2508721 RepID=A0A4Q1DA49_9BACT|nr:rhamnogalacturonan acetylesterase [Filimonas effusa]RXK85778.1 rhamnogalacturonan acetylesterase [Filimonas effusa]